MGKKKKNARGSNSKYYIPNISAFALVLCLGCVNVYEILGSITETSQIIVNVIILLVVTLVSLILVFVYTKNFTNLAFYVPAILFLSYTFLMAINGWNLSTNYLLACLCFCVIGCLYYNLKLSVFYAIAQYVVVGLLILGGYSVMGPGVPLPKVWFTWSVSLYSALILLALVRYATVILGRAVASQTSFRTLLSTTTSNIAMVDNQNRVMYVSNSMSELTGIASPELAVGRPLIDLFPGRDLKLLVHKLLKNKQMWTDDWEFTLNGQKRYFKAISTSMAGNSREALINLHDLTHLAERDEISVMKDSLKIGLFFIDRAFIIQDHYSRYLDEMFMEKESLFGRHFPGLLTSSVTERELETIQDYFNMIFDKSVDADMLREINPLNEIRYVSNTTGKAKVFHFDFTTIERGRGETYILATVYDITAKIELQQQLKERENKRQEEMQSIFELLQVEQDVFGDFQEDADEKFAEINGILKNTTIPTHDALVEIYQNIHAIKSNAVILGLNVFGNKAHDLESKVKKLREQKEEIPFDDMLGLTMEIEKLFEEFDGFKVTIEKIQTFNKTVGTGQGKNQREYVLIESLSRTASRAAEDMEKKVQFVIDDLDTQAIEKGSKRVIKDVLMQLIRNSVVHGIEMPDERVAKGKDETGIIRLSIKVEGENIIVRLEDDGGGLNYDKIRRKAEELNLLKEEDKDNKSALSKLIFLPEFSTADTEGLHAGRGMGLNLVRDRVRDVRGSIDLQSRQDKGTVFSITIPL